MYYLGLHPPAVIIQKRRRWKEEDGGCLVTIQVV